MTILDIALAKLSKNADAVGEVLRDSAFDPGNGIGYGCYSTFEVHKAFVKVDAGSSLGMKILRNFARADYDVSEDLFSVEGFIEDSPGVENNIYSSGDVHMVWYWEGGGSLFFALPSENKALINTDCKKDHGWRWCDWKDGDCNDSKAAFCEEK